MLGRHGHKKKATSLALIGSLLRLMCPVCEARITPFPDQHGEYQVCDLTEQYDLAHPDPAVPESVSCFAEAQADEKYAT